MFPFEGARQTHDEAERIYKLYGAEDRLQWITGPGGHGNLGPISPQILAFFTKNLKGSDAESAFTALRVQRREDLQVTPTGQVSTSLGGESVYSLNRKWAESVMAPHAVLVTKADVSRLQTRLRQDIRTLTGAVLQPGASHPLVTVKSAGQHDEYQTQTISLRSDGDAEISGSVAIPKVAGVRRPAILVIGPAAEADVDSLAKAGRIVMTVDARPTPAGTESIKSPYLGIFNLISLRAFLVGKTLIGLRIDDAIRAMDWLTARGDVDPSAITIYGNGPLGMVALHAAALDSRIGRVVMENPLASYRMIVDQPVHRNVSEVVIPGVLRHYDTADLMEAVHPRPVVVIAPQDALGMALSEQEFRSALASVYQSDQKLGSPQRVRFRTRSPGEPLPLD
jgi:hypothetical protein